MYVSVKILKVTLISAVLCGCVGAGRAPSVHLEMIRLGAGEVHIVDTHHNGHGPNISAHRNGYLFIHSTLFDESPQMTDLAGSTQVLLFVPEKFVAASRSAVTRISRKDGLQAYEYSKNDASLESYCFQELSEGAVSIRTHVSTTVIESDLRSPPVKEPTDARCDSSSFLATAEFPI